MALKNLYESVTGADAHLLRNFLEAEGIPAEVQGENLRIAYGGVLKGSGQSVWVKEEDFEDALEVLARFRAGGPEAGAEKLPDWKCARCGESNEGPFTECWKCLTPRELP